LKIRIGHSPDSDDAFMFYGIAKNKIDTNGYEIEHVVEDIESLNHRAMKGELEVTAVSIHAYAYLHKDYSLMSCGASMGENYGPMVIGKKMLSDDELRNSVIAIPGEKTSAYLAMRLYLGDFKHKIVDFDQIIDAVKAGEVDAGLIIHEGQLTHPQNGLTTILDLGKWWYSQNGLPLPLGGNVIRKDLGEQTAKEIQAVLKASIEYSLNHREEGLEYAKEFARGIEFSTMDKFVDMYVNQRTLDYGSSGREAVQLFLDHATEAKLIPDKVEVQFIEN
jgi:1,4-dihydroxy-6-naphthoate synthase